MGSKRCEAVLRNGLEINDQCLHGPVDPTYGRELTQNLYRNIVSLHVANWSPWRDGGEFCAIPEPYHQLALLLIRVRHTYASIITLRYPLYSREYIHI